jgi:hypothetical protein
VDFRDLVWSSDWSGDEVGYDDVELVGLYQLKHADYDFYIDMSTMEILKVFYCGDE